MIKELNKIHLSPDTTFEEIIMSINTSEGTITFKSEDLPPEGTTQNNALYFDSELPSEVFSLMDNESTVNVYP